MKKVYINIKLKHNRLIIDSNDFVILHEIASVIEQSIRDSQ